MATDVSTSNQNNFKVRLVTVASLMSGLPGDNPEQVIFEVTPTISVTGSVEYAAITPIHMPGSIQVYKHTNSRQFNVTAHFISRNVQEATQNRIYLKTLEGWKMNYFGAGSTITTNQQQARNQRQANTTTGQSSSSLQTGDQPLSPEQRASMAQSRIASEGINLQGAPPDILYFYGYSSSGNDTRQTPYSTNLNRIPVVVSNIEYSYPEDCDYLPTFANLAFTSPQTSSSVTAQSEPFPMKMDVSITLLETHSPREFEQFDLSKFKNGTLVNF